MVDENSATLCGHRETARVEERPGVEVAGGELHCIGQLSPAPTCVKHLGSWRRASSCAGTELDGASKGDRLMLR
jgi:hypothetical protein